MFKTIVISWVFSVSAGVAAETTCPAVGSEYTELLSKLSGIQTAIKSDRNCKDVALNVKSLSDLIIKDRQRVLQIIEDSQGQPLTAEESKIVQDYAENLTTKVAALNDLFSQSNYCFRDDQPEQQLAALASFVGEASQLLSTLSGPWGTPIALAGNVVAGYLTGLNKVFKSRAPEYDFSKPELWSNYVRDLCTYFGYREQVVHLLHPQERIKQLNELKSRLDTKIENLQITDSFHTVQNLAWRDWIVKEIARIQRENETYWGDSSGRYLLAQAKSEIEDVLIERRAPQFIEYDIKKSSHDFDEFRNFLAQEGQALYKTIEHADRRILTHHISPARLALRWVNAISYFEALVIHALDFDWLIEGPQKDDLKFSAQHFREQSLERLVQAQTSVRMTQSFCDFFRHAGFYTSAVRQQCTSDQLTGLLAEQKALRDQLPHGQPAQAREYNREMIGLTPFEILKKKIEGLP